jgi:aryl-alcohol dehydrogenase-like predicted oxidoreductase
VGGCPQGGLLRLTPSAGAHTSASARSHYPATVEVRRLGRTGHRSSVAILGGAAFWDSDRDVAASAFTAALATGVNHLDVAPQYGRAQELLGPLIPAVRDGLFVACKTLRHSRDGVRAQLEESLRLLHCDHFDLYQLHAVTDLAELDARSGALEAIMSAREEGLCRWVGITGHELTAPAAHLEAVRRYDLDTVMFPVNPQLWSDSAYRHDAEALLDHAGDHDIGVMAIKAAAARPWAGRVHTSSTWYEPYTSEAEVSRGVRFALSVPGVHGFCTPGDLGVLPVAIEAAQRFAPMDVAEREEAMGSVTGEPSIFPMPTV